MSGRAAGPFAALLRELRLAAGLTQEQLAQGAQLSVRSVSDLERGVNRSARRETARLLADALALSGTARTEFVELASGRSPGPAGVLRAADGVAVATRTLPRDLARFTGRDDELRSLTRIVSRPAAPGRVVTICAIGGMAGVGKTAFAVHAAHHLAGLFPDGQIYLPLHGHTSGQRPVDPADALASLLLTAGVTAAQIPPGIEARARLWRDHVAGRRFLLLLDDATSHEQVRPLLPASQHSLVLVTSRRNLTALEDTRTIRLDVMSPADAAALLIQVADRPELDPGDQNIGQITRLCGYLPLAIAMLARQLHYHPAWTCERLAANLASAQDRLHLMHAEDLSVAAAFDLSYQDLDEEQRRLFRRLGLHPGRDFDAFAAAALDDSTVADAQHRLDVLYDHHLLIENAQGRYRLHDLLRESARARAEGDEAEAWSLPLSRLAAYYTRAAQAAARHIPRRSPGNSARSAVTWQAAAPDLPTRQAAIAWMNADRVNLHAVASYAAAHGAREYAVALPAAMHTFLLRHGYWDQAVALDELAIDAARGTGNAAAQADARTDLGDMQELIGDYEAAIANFTGALTLLGDLDNDIGRARALNELGAAQRATGDIAAAINSHEQALRLYRRVRDNRGEASARSMLGEALRIAGQYDAAADSQAQALRLYQELNDRFGEAIALNRLGRVQQAIGRLPEALASHQKALYLNQELNDKIGQASALRAQAMIQRTMGDRASAAHSYREALRLYRELGHQLAIDRTIGDLNTLAESPGPLR